MTAIGGFTNQNFGGNGCCCKSSREFYYTEIYGHKANWGQLAPNYWVFSFDDVKSNNNIMIPTASNGMWNGFRVEEEGTYRIILSDMVFTLKGLEEAWLQIFINDELIESTPTRMGSQQYLNSLVTLKKDDKLYVRIWTMEDTDRKNIQSYPYDTSTIPNMDEYKFPIEGRVGGFLRIETV